VRSASLGADLAAINQEAVQRDLATSVTVAYGAAVNAVATQRTVAAGLERAEGDLALAERRRDQGLVTEADVLQMSLHVAEMRQRQIRAAADQSVARARLNQLIGVSLDEVFQFDDAIDTGALASGLLVQLEASAVNTRPETRIAILNQSLADSTVASARAAFLPRVSAMAAWEANGERWDSRAAGWMVGAVARLNLFHGLGDQARRAEARELQLRRRAERERVETLVRLDVRAAQARLDAARSMLDVTEAAVAQAVESHRIVRDRYEAGLADVTALLRAAEGVQNAETQRVASRVEVLVATATWRRAVGQ
jgi:outer membrane protein TolC